MSNSSGPIGTSLDRLRQELDTLLESAWSNGEKALDRIGLRSSNAVLDPSVDVFETIENVLVIVDLPGIDPAQVEVSLVGNMLTVKGERLPAIVGEGATRHLVEIRQGKFSRSVPLPVAVNPEAVAASSHNGVLTIQLQKQHVAKPRQIPIQIQSSPPSGPA